MDVWAGAACMVSYCFIVVMCAVCVCLLIFVAVMPSNMQAHRSTHLLHVCKCCRRALSELQLEACDKQEFADKRKGKPEPSVLNIRPDLNLNLPRNVSNTGWSDGKLIEFLILSQRSWKLTRYHCWFHMGSSNSLSTGQSLQSLKAARLLRRFSYCCSAHSTCAHAQRRSHLSSKTNGSHTDKKILTGSLTRSSSDSCLVMCSLLRLILRGWLRCLNKKWFSRAPI